MRAIALLAVLSLLLAGCSGDAGDSGDTPSTSSSTTATTGPPPKPVVHSDTLHFLEAPRMAPALPLGSSEVRTPTNSFGSFGGGGGQGDDEPSSLWDYQLANDANLTGGEIHVWVEITETLFPSPFMFPGQDSCTWYVILHLGADNEVDVPCLTEPAGPISASTKELVFTFLNTDTLSLQANETISLRFGRTAFGASTEPSVFVLSGSADHDSRIQIKGLKEVVDE